MHRTYIGAIERCEKNLSLSSLEIIAEALGITVPELLTPKRRRWLPSAYDYVRNIKNAQLTIHDPIQVGDPNLWIPDEFLEELLNNKLMGLNVNYPIRTRSKVVKQAVCDALGYPIEQKFPKYQPRFTGQNFDTYNQQVL